MNEFEWMMLFLRSWLYSADVHRVRPHKGQRLVASRFRSILPSATHPSEVSGFCFCFPTRVRTVTNSNTINIMFSALLCIHDRSRCAGTIFQDGLKLINPVLSCNYSYTHNVTLSHYALIFVSAICNFWPQLQILWDQMIPLTDPAFPGLCIFVFLEKMAKLRKLASLCRGAMYLLHSYYASDLCSWEWNRADHFVPAPTPSRKLYRHLPQFEFIKV